MVVLHDGMLSKNIFLLHENLWGGDSAVGIATGYGLDGPGIESSGGRARFYAPVQTGPGAHPASYTMGTGSLPWLKARGGALTTNPLSAEVEGRIEL